MNLFKYLLSAFLFVAAAEAQECRAKLILSSDISDVNYYINGHMAGSGSEFSAELDTGTYFLAAEKDGKVWSPLTFKDTVVISGCSDIKKRFSFSSIVPLRSDPPDAYVYNNDTLLGYTPLYVDKNSVNLVLKKPGYRDEYVNVNPGSVIKLEQISERNGKLFYQKDLFKYLIGGLLVLGGTSAYFKLKADDNYDNYQITGGQSYLDKTHKFDTISGITFGALQLNFGLLLYYFLSE